MDITLSLLFSCFATYHMQFLLMEVFSLGQKVKKKSRHSIHNEFLSSFSFKTFSFLER